MSMSKKITPEMLALMFHDAYRFFALTHGYRIQEDTRELDLSSTNGKIIVSTCELLLAQLKDHD